MSYFEDRLAEIRSNPSLVRMPPVEKPKKAKQPKAKLRPAEGTKEGIIYLVRSGDAVKIGYTQDLGLRLADLQTGNPNKLHVMESFRSHKEAEKLVHKRFKADRISGEWFNMSFEIEEFCADLMDYRGMRATDVLSGTDASGADLLAELVETFVPLDDVAFILTTIGEPWPATFPNRPTPSANVHGG